MKKFDTGIFTFCMVSLLIILGVSVYKLDSHNKTIPVVDTNTPPLVSKTIKGYVQPLEFDKNNNPKSWLTCDTAEQLNNGHYFLSGNVVYSKDNLTIHCKSCFFDPNTNKVYNAKNIKIY